MLIGIEFRVKLTWKQTLHWLLLEERSQYTKLDMPPRRKCWKEGPKSKASWDIQVRSFVILKVQGIAFNRLVLMLPIYISETKKLVRLLYPYFLDAYVLSIFDPQFSTRIYWNRTMNHNKQSSFDLTFQKWFVSFPKRK